MAINTTKVITDLSELRRSLDGLRMQAKSIGLVPTMGALHQGHMSLVERSVANCDVTVTSIFVNPTQFAPQEDLSKYPRDLDKDILLLADHGVDLVFAPTEELMYPPGFSTFVQPPALAKVLEGEFRPGHFQGVATVVLKLLNQVQPHQVFFGQKDFQQAAVIGQMVEDLNVPVKIEVCPIVRDPDGLALSSRNVYLDPDQRKRALALSACLFATAKDIEQGEADGHVLMAEMKQRLIDGGVSDIDYAVVADPQTLQTLDHVMRPVVLLIAAHVDSTRLIDNLIID